MSNNEQLNREIENLLTAYINELLQPRAQPVAAPSPVSAPEERITNRRYYTLLTELIHDYNANIQMYQQNMRDLIQTIRNAPPMQTTQPAPAQIPITTTTTLFSYFLQPTQPATAPELSAEQIQQHTSMVDYHAEMNEVRCPICLEDFEIGEQVCKIVACGHFFKRPGLMSWFERNTHCPVCRCDILNAAAAAATVPVPAATVPVPAAAPAATVPVPVQNNTPVSTRRAFGPEPPPTTGVPLFTPNRILQQAFSNLQAPVMNEVNSFLRNLGNNLDVSFNEMD